MWADFIPLVSLLATFVARKNGTPEVKVSGKSDENVFHPKVNLNRFT